LLAHLVCPAECLMVRFYSHNRMIYMLEKLTCRFTGNYPLHQVRW
jgi:hypothetical protein